MNRIYKFPFTIAYADTDAGGIVYHGRYIEIAERARMDMLVGTEWVSGDVGFVVRDLKTRYIQPLVLGDKIFIETCITELGAASLSFEQKFVKDGKIYAILMGTAAYIGGNLRIKRIPDAIIRAIKEQ